MKEVILVKLIKDEFVPKSQAVPWDYIIYNIFLDDDIEVGRLVFRCGTEEQLKYCGHIGYHIDEPFRGHSYAYQALCLLLPILYQLGYRKLIITCHYNNIASQKTIEKLPVISKHLELDIDDDEYKSKEGLWIYEIEVKE